MKIKDILDRCSESNVGYSMSVENKQLAEFTSNYARDIYGDDWKLILTITYNKPIKNEYLCRTIIKQIFSELKERDYIIDGIFVNEFDRNWNLHNHIIIYTDCNIEDAKSIINDRCRKNKIVGEYDIQNYINDGGWCIYMFKYVNLNKENSWDMISNLFKSDSN